MNCTTIEMRRKLLYFVVFAVFGLLMTIYTFQQSTSQGHNFTGKDASGHKYKIISVFYEPPPPSSSYNIKINKLRGAWGKLQEENYKISKPNER